jgi:surfeit locus 1 family protein
MMRAPRLLLLAIALAAAAGTARLGLWQLDRAAQKNALQVEIDARTGLPPLAARELARRPQDAAAQVHRRALVEGRWLPAHTVWLDNRQMDGRPGFFVLTPLALDDGSALLVQRGWQPRDFVERSRVAPPPTPDGPVRIGGRLARDPARLVALGEDAPGPIRQNLDIDAFARETGLALRPLTLLQESPTDQDALRRDWPRPAAGVHKHHGYAFQWFALSALIVGLYVWFQLVRPLRRA